MSTSTFATTQLTPAVRKVLVNTYLLLSMSLVVSGASTYMALDSTFFTTVTGFIVTLVGALALLFLLMAVRNSPIALPVMFAFSALMGASMGPMVNHYLDKAGDAVMLALFMTGGIFIVLSGYVITTGKDFKGLGKLLFVAIVSLLLLLIANMFIQSSVMQMALAYAGAVVFSLFILYDTSEVVSGRETNYVMAAVSQYLNLINLFQFLLQIITGIGDD